MCEVLVAAADILGHVDIADIRWRAECRIGREHQIPEASRLAGSDVEDAANLRARQQPHHHPHHIVDIDEIAPLIAVFNPLAVRLEQFHRPARFDIVEAPRQHAHHRALVIFVGAEHVEEFQPGPLRRQPVASCRALGDGHVEQMLAPAVQIHRAQRLQRRYRLIVAKSLRAIAIGRCRGGIDQRRRIGGAPVQQPHRQPEIGLDHEIAVGRGGLRNGAEVDNGVQPAAFQPVRQLVRRHDIGKLALGEIAPFAVLAEQVAHGHIGAARVIQRGHDVRSDKTGATGHQQHAVPCLIVRCQLCPTPARQATWVIRRGEEGASLFGDFTRLRGAVTDRLERILPLKK